MLIKKYEQDEKTWNDFKKIYETSFDPTILDPIEVYKEASATGETDIYLIYDDNENTAGYFTIDPHETSVILNLIHIEPEQRGKKYGSLLIKYIKDNILKNRALIAEVDDDVMKFYTNINFKKIEIPYFIPNMDNEDELIPYNIIQYNKKGKELSKKQLKKIFNDLFLISYDITKDDKLYTENMKNLSKLKEKKVKHQMK